MEQFQLDVVLCQVDANAAEWGRNKTARGYRWKKGCVKNPPLFVVLYGIDIWPYEKPMCWYWMQELWTLE